MLYKRGGVWWLKIKFGGALIRESTGFKSKTAARDVQVKRLNDLREGAAGTRKNRPRLLSAVAADWLATKAATLAPSSLRIEKGNLAHLLPIFGRTLDSDIDAAHVARYQQKRRNDGAAAATINLEVGTLRAILRRRGRWAAIAPDVRMLAERMDAGRAISEDEENRLLAACRESRSRALYPTVVLAISTGLRYSELTGLTWDRIDFERRLLRVGKSKTRQGEGRIVPLNARAFAVLQFWAGRGIETRPEQFVFCSEKYGQGGAVYDRDPFRPVGDLKEAWEGAKKRSGVRCRWHDLRHTCVSRLTEAGAGLPMLAGIFGWSSSTMAAMSKRYGHASAEAVRGVMELLDRADFASKGAQKGAQSENLATALPS